MAEKKKTITKAKAKTVKKTVSKKAEVSLEKLLESGAHLGHQVKRWNPKMKDFIYGVSDGVHVFDLVKTKEKLEEALKVLKEAKKTKKSILFVGTKKQAQEKTKEVAQATGSFYITQRFLGGTFTNFNQIKKSINKLHDLKEKVAKGEFDSYTKKERLLISREIMDLEKNFSGIAEMTRLPDVVVVVDTHREKGALVESKRVGITTIGLVDSNADPSVVDYPIPMNDDAVKAINYVLDLIKEALS